MAGLLKELWIDLLIGDEAEFFENDTFLSHGMNMSYAVDNDRINFAYKGPRPAIVKNFRTNGTTELTSFIRTDVADHVVLDNYSTQKIVLPHVDLFALPYEKKNSLMVDARLALVASIADEGIWKIGPGSDTANTPIIVVDAANASAQDNYDSITRADIVKLRIEMDLKYPGLKSAEWFLMMDTNAYWQLLATDTVLQQQYGFSSAVGMIMNTKSMPAYIEIADFKIWRDSRTPWYDATNVKLAYGATITPGTHRKSAIAYIRNETFCNALGSTEMFGPVISAGKQAEETSFLSRAYVGPWGVTAANFKYAGAIIRTPAV